MDLGKAGEGLPSFERLFIKNFLVPCVRVLFTWDIALFMLKKEIKKIEKVVHSVENKELLKKQVIINRAFAIEDHSRQFSINMVCEHLVIAGSAVSMIIQTISKEQEFPKEVKIEAVKPHENKDETINDLLAFTKEYETMIKSLNKKQSKTKVRHPWFIEFNNFDWSCFMYMHTFIHRRQIEEIIKVLGEENAK